MDLPVLWLHMAQTICKKSVTQETSNTTGINQPATTSGIPVSTNRENPDDLEMDVFSQDAKLVHIFYATLPSENQEAAPKAWEAMQGDS
jgi:hypothetical protein